MPFAKGQSGNPGGRPKDQYGVRELAREYGLEAIRILRAIMRDKKAPQTARIAAGVALLDRGFGKPTQIVGGDEEMPVIHEIRQVIVYPEEHHGDRAPSVN